MKHTKGPWKTDRDCLNSILIVDPNGGEVCSTYNPDGSDLGPADRENAERIVECVNACEGIENPAVIKELIELATYLWHPDNRDPNIYTAMDMAQKALAALGVK